MNFKSIFSICFPAMTGIMAGANQSGALADPGKSIGRGTLNAIFTALFIYVVLSVALASSFSNHALVRNPCVARTPPGAPPGPPSRTHRLPATCGGPVACSRMSASPPTPASSDTSS